MSTDSDYTTLIKAALQKYKAEDIKSQIEKTRLISFSIEKTKYLKILLFNAFKYVCSKESNAFKNIMNMSEEDLTNITNLVREFSREESDDRTYLDVFNSDKYSPLKVLSIKDSNGKEDFIKELRLAHNELYEMNDALVTEVTNFVGLSRRSFDWKFAVRDIFDGAHYNVVHTLFDGIIIPFSPRADLSLTDILIANEDYKTELFNQVIGVKKLGKNDPNNLKEWYQFIVTTLRRNSEILFDPAPTFETWKIFTANADFADYKSLTVKSIQMQLDKFIKSLKLVQTDSCVYTPFPKYLEKFNAQPYHLKTKTDTPADNQIEDINIANEIFNPELFLPANAHLWNDKNSYVRQCFSCAGAHHPIGTHIFKIDVPKYIYSMTQEGKSFKMPIEGTTDLPLYSGQLALFPALEKSYHRINNLSGYFSAPSRRNYQGERQGKNHNKKQRQQW